MKLRNGILRPGTVVEVLENNEIRAEVPGLFSREDGEKLPPILPCPFGYQANHYSQIEQYDDVWIMNFSDNPLQLYWFRKDDYKTNNKDIICEENVEILCNRDGANGWATMYFSDGSGWIIRNGQSVVQIRPDGSILLNTNTNNRAIDINSDNISLGSVGKSAHPAAYGDVAEELFSQIQLTFSLIKQAASMSPYTKPISVAIGNIPNQMSKTIPKLISTNVTLD